MSHPNYVARILRKCQWVRVGSFKNNAFFEDPTRVQRHFGGSAQHSIPKLVMVVMFGYRHALFQTVDWYSFSLRSKGFEQIKYTQSILPQD